MNATERMAAVVDGALDCIIIVDHRSRVVEFNPAAEATFGWKRQDVLGTSMASLIMPERYRAAHDRGMQRYLASGDPRVLGKRLHLTGQRADGSEFPLELTVIRLGDGEEPHFCGFLRDVSERHAIDEANRKAQEAAEQAARDIALALKATSTLLSAPLSTLTASLAGTQLPERARLAVRRASAIVDDLRDLSQLEAGALVLEPGPMDPGPWVAELGLDLVGPAHRVRADPRARRVVQGVLDWSRTWAADDTVTLVRSEAVELVVQLSNLEPPLPELTVSQRLLAHLGGALVFRSPDLVIQLPSAPDQVEVPVVYVDADIEDLVQEYIDEQRARLPAVRAALDQGDWDPVRRWGHQLKGSGDSYGFPPLSRLGSALEVAARAHDAQAAQFLEGLEQYLANVRWVTRPT